MAVGMGWSSWEQLVLKMTADLMGGCEQLGSWVHHGFGERLGTQWVLGRSWYRWVCWENSWLIGTSGDPVGNSIKVREKEVLLTKVNDLEPRHCLGSLSVFHFTIKHNRLLNLYILALGQLLLVFLIWSLSPCF